MTSLKILKPSPSYVIAVPDEVRESYDDGVSSFWCEGQPLLLQVSSYLRTEGRQVPAQIRLSERMTREPRQWSVWTEAVHPDVTVDQATAECADENEVLWVHSYLVWPHLTLYVLVSGPISTVRQRNNWAMTAVKEIKLAVQ